MKIKRKNSKVIEIQNVGWFSFTTLTETDEKNKIQMTIENSFRPGEIVVDDLHELQDLVNLLHLAADEILKVKKEMGKEV